MNVAQKLSSEWNFKSVIPLATTPTSKILKVEYLGQAAILKVFTELGKKYEAPSTPFLQGLNGKGLLKLLQSNEDAQLLEFLDGTCLEEFFKKKGDRESIKIIIEVLKKIHSFKGDILGPHPDLKTQFRSLAKKVLGKDCSSLFKQGYAIAEELIDSETDKRFLHGDVHHSNILHSSQRGWLALDPQYLYAERTYEVANCFFNPYCLETKYVDTQRIKTMAAEFSKGLGIDEKRILKFAFAHGTLSACWAEESGNSPERRTYIATQIKKIIGI